MHDHNDKRQKERKTVLKDGQTRNDRICEVNDAASFDCRQRLTMTTPSENRITKQSPNREVTWDATFEYLLLGV